MQFDLFEHSRDVMLRNDVVRALRTGAEVEARKALAVLSAEFPNDNLLTPLTALLHMAAAPPQRFSDHREVLNVLDHMDTVVAPAANLVFDAEDARRWLALVWRSLANTAVGLTFDVERPRAHAAFMFLKCGYWVAAEARITTVPSWRQIPASLAWMAEARFGQGGLEAAWCLLVELAWRSASLFGALAGRVPAPELRNLLDQFNRDFDSSDDEPHLAWFPAWALIAEPGLASVLRQSQPCGNKVPERAARIVMELLSLERQGRHPELIDQRRRLQNLHAGLFAHYMSTR